MATKNYYQILQVDPSAEPEVISAAYKRLATKYHPDTNKSADANERMQMLNEAYATLSDPVRRAAYDRLLAPAGNDMRSGGNSSDLRSEANRPTNTSPAGQKSGYGQQAQQAGWAAGQTGKASNRTGKTAMPPTQGNTSFGSGSVIVTIAIAIGLMILVVVGYGSIGLPEVVIVLVVSLVLTRPVSAWIRNKNRKQ